MDSVELIALTVSEAEVDVVSGELWGFGVDGIEERPAADGLVDLVVSGDPDLLSLVIGDRWPHRRVEVDPDCWVDSWKPWATAVEVAEGVVVRPPWVVTTGEALEVVIDPERAWGHGAHPTTVLCAGWLARRRPVPRRVLDVGCGSGTLSVAAALFGSAIVHAIDTDPEAVLATTANAVANGVSERVSASDEPIEEVDGVFDVVVANIGAATLRGMAEPLAARLAEGATLVLSGFFPDDAGMIADTYRRLGLGVVTSGERDGWALLTLASR